MTVNQIAFLKSRSFAVAGASNNREKYGNIVFRALLEYTAQDGRDVLPIHPALKEVEGHTAYPDLAALPSVPEALSIVTPPAVTRKVVGDAISAVSTESGCNLALRMTKRSRQRKRPASKYSLTAPAS